MNLKKERVKLAPEQLFAIFQECSTAGAPVKAILERHGMKPWDFVVIRKRIKEAALEALSGNGKRGRKKAVVPIEQYQNICRQLEESKDALTAVGHELALLKKRVNSA